MGVLLKSNGPSIAVCSNIVRFFWQGIKTFKVIVADWMRQKQRCMANWVSMLASTAIKWSLHVLMDHSATFTWWMCGGTNWYMMSSCQLYLLRITDASLSRNFTHGLYPLFLRCLTCFGYASSIWMPGILLQGSYKISLASYTYIISIYLLPWLDVIWNYLSGICIYYVFHTL